MAKLVLALSFLFAVATPAFAGHVKSSSKAAPTASGQTCTKVCPKTGKCLVWS